MGNVCCDDKPNGIVPPAHEFVTNEQFVNKLADVSSVTHQQSGSKEGAVHINLDLVETVLLADDDEPDRTMQGPRRKSRQGTGFVTQEQLSRVNSEEVKVSFAKSESNDDQKKGRGSARKGTGFVTKDKLLEMLDNLSDEEDEEEQVEEAGKAKSSTSEVTAKVSKTESAAPDAITAPEVRQRVNARKSTGFVTQNKLKKVLQQTQAA